MMQFLKRRWYIILIILALSGLFFLKINSSPGNTKNGKKQTSYIVKQQTLKETLSLSGSIDAEEKVTLRFQSSGRISWVGVKMGDYVKKYQTIASLDQRELKKNLEKYLNTFVNERYDFEQTRDDYWQKQYALSDGLKREAERIIKKAQNDLTSAVLDVELKNLSLEYASLWTPIEGIVTKVGAPFAGVNATPTQAEFEIINPKTIYFSATADQNDVVKLKEGENGEVILDAYPDKTFAGKIKMISFIPKEGETGTVYEVKMVLGEANDSYQYRFGMTGDASFTLKEKEDVLSIPSNYIKTEKGKKYVWKKQNGGKTKAYITIGEEIDNSTEITSGLSPGDTIYD
jgi:RND family efflux transporter MFP subunit